jgi:alpha-amylase/alpha-mannosidase (GH57 family)
MLNLAFIFHMHQPYYKNLLTGESPVPWVRLHGAKDYLDMVQILSKYSKIHQTFNLVPSLVEQIEDYCNANVRDRFMELTLKPAETLNSEEKRFVMENFFSINKEKVISLFPRYYELYFKRVAKYDFNTQDILDLQVLFNLAWIDPSFRESFPELKAITLKGRFFNEADKQAVINCQIKILKDIIPAYKEAIATGQIEVTVSPYYHPILPLLITTNSAKEADNKTLLPESEFSYPQDAQKQIDEAVDFFRERFGATPHGMWPSEESVCKRIVPYIINSGIKWIVTDEAILFKSLKKKKRTSSLLYQPYKIRVEDGELCIVFRDRNLSDLIGFVYHGMSAREGADNFMRHLENINNAFKGKDILVTVAMDGENAWEYYPNDGHDFLNQLYTRLSEASFVNVTTINEYLKHNPVKKELKHLSAGSWIYGNFGKWMNNPYKAKAWEWLYEARVALEAASKDKIKDNAKAWKQMYILEGSDWFWWYGEDPHGEFDRLFRMHLINLYTLINIDPPEYLKSSLTA